MCSGNENFNLVFMNQRCMQTNGPAANEKKRGGVTAGGWAILKSKIRKGVDQTNPDPENSISV